MYKQPVSHPLAVVDLTIAEQSKMRILVQPHWLHPIQAIHNLQAMETNYTVLQLKTHSTMKLPFKYLQLSSKTLSNEEQKVNATLKYKKFSLLCHTAAVH
jgi:hypothetical protein